MKAVFPSDLCLCPRERGAMSYCSGAILSIWRLKPASQLPGNPCSTTVLPAGRKEKLCPPSQPRAPFLSLVPAIAVTQPLASRGRKPVQQPALENQSSSPQNTLVFNEIRCLKARLHFFCSISDFNQHELFELFFFSCVL